MSAFFQFFKPGVDSEWPGKFEVLFYERNELRQVVYDVLNLADSAALFFRGSYPINSPHFPWGDLISLPWDDDYWNENKDGRSWSPVSIIDEAENIARHLTEVAKVNVSDTPWKQVTYGSSDLCGDGKQFDMLTMQGLAVEAMLAVDGFLSCISRKEFIESMPWLVSANANILECTSQANKILGSVSENARTSANKRHIENRAMKAEVFVWLDANMPTFKSMDAAAQAITRQQPIAFRTARDWTGQWKKLRSASTP